MIWTLAFWKGAAERAFHTFWQTFSAILLLAVGSDLVPALGVEGVNWTATLSGAAVAAILSLAKSLGSPEFTAGRTEVEVKEIPVPIAVLATDATSEAVPAEEAGDAEPRRGAEPLGFHI